jgi:FkbM family methyltransferase
MSFALRVETEVRSIARRWGVISLLSRLRAALRRREPERYEARFREVLERTVGAADVVWDVGANVGVYAELFATRVGPRGLVCAFEPAPACFEALRKRLQPFSQARVFNFALGSTDGTLPLGLARDPLAPTHSFFGGDRSLEVRVARADSLIERREVVPPNVIKIDVEGFEEEVLAGATELLRSPDVRAIFLEVHFGILDARGRKHAPASIVEKLRASGFSTRWVDRSHLIATRG